MIEKIQAIKPMFQHFPKHVMPLEAKKKENVSEETKSFAEVLKEAKEKKMGTL